MPTPTPSGALTAAYSRMMHAALAHAEACRKGLKPTVLQRLMEQYTESLEAWQTLMDA